MGRPSTAITIEGAAVVLLAVSVSLVGAPAAAADTSPAAMVSRYRLANGLTSVSADPLLTRLASVQAAAMARTSTLSHTVAGAFYGRLSQSGFRFVRAGENLGEGYHSFSEAMEGWKGSDGHRANLLINGATRIGYARATSAAGRPYWALVLAAPEPSSPRSGPHVQAAKVSAKQERKISAKQERAAASTTSAWPFGLNPFNLFR